MAVTPEDLTSKNNNTLSTALGTQPTPLPIPKTFGKEAKGYMETMQPLIKEAAQAEGELKKFEYETQAKTAKNKAKTEREYIDKVQNLNKTAEEKEAEFPRPEFHPTQENALSLGSLFSLVSTMGMLVGASGKQSAGNAMSAMTGMLKGWQTGRKDLYEKELKEFDKEYKRITDIRNEIQKKLEKSIALQTSDKEASFLELASAEALADSNSVLGITMKKYGAQEGLKLIKDSYKIQADFDAIKAKKEEAQANRDLRYEIAQLKSGSGTGGKVAKEVVQAHSLRENLIPALEEAVPVLRRLNKEGKWNDLSALLRSQDVVGLNQAEWAFRNDKEAINLIRTLAFFRSKEFETAGKALTKTENQILAPLYQAGARPFEAMENNLLQSLTQLSREQLKLERQFPSLQSGTTPEIQPRVNIPTITTQAEFDALPEGSVYIEDDKKYTKPRNQK